MLHTNSESGSNWSAKYDVTTTDGTADYRAVQQKPVHQDQDGLRALPLATKLEERKSGPFDSLLYLNVLLTLAVKRRRDIKSGEEPSRTAKRRKGNRPGVAGVTSEKENYIEHWLDESCHSGKIPVEDLPGQTDTMPHKPVTVLPSPIDSFERSTSTSRKSERSTASVHDSDYHQSLQNRNIYIDREDPPPDLVRRAKRIVSRHRASPEMDDAAIQKLKEKSRRLRNEAEDVIVKQLASHLIPAMNEVPDRRLEMNSDQQWSDSVPVPLDPDVLTNPIPLPKPKPDLAFGYSQDAFSHKQLMTIELLVDDEFGRSYVVPDQKLQFPFLDIEFKSQAKGGTHYIATNQAAGAGAIALNGNLELMQRSFGMTNFDYDEPQFFSITMDHELARINIHWLKPPADGGHQSFHVEGLSQHLLRDASGIRAVTRAIKNILDYGADTRLRTLCKALDAYRDTVVRNRDAANPQKLRHAALAKVRGDQGRRDREVALKETSTRNRGHASVPKDTSANELAAEEVTTKRDSHGPSTTRNIGMGTSNAALKSISQPLIGSAEKSTHNVATQATTTSRHTIPAGAEEQKRRIRPTRKLMESRYNLIGTAEPMGRHDP